MRLQRKDNLSHPVSKEFYFLHLPLYKNNTELPLSVADKSADVAELQYKTGTIHHNLDEIVTLIHSAIIIFLTE